MVLHATYEEATGCQYLKPAPPTTECMPSFSLRNVASPLLATVKLTAIVLCPAALFVQVLLWVFGVWRSGIILLVSLCVFVYHFLFVVHSRSVHAKPGLFYKPTPRLDALLSRCKKLTSPCAIDASLGEPGLCRTWWTLGGDLRTLLPFLTNQPKKVVYQRWFCRVPISDGPRNFRQNDAKAFEAVAIDCTTATAATNASSCALLILAGLTGGSHEGYVLDLVNEANEANMRCFVLIGRGLSGSPNRSEAGFHGARTTDLEVAARKIKSLLPVGQELVCIGISMGGIIAVNAAARNQLDSSIAALVCVSGCMCAAKNVTYQHSRRVWQPLLAFGLKESFCTSSEAWSRMAKRMGTNRLAEKIASCADVFEFDQVVVAPTNQFRDVWEYYDDMCASSAEPTNFNIPVLFIHALDDPIIHPDTNEPERTGRGENVVFLSTNSGGHVGFPLGIFPWQNRFAFTNQLAIEFALAASTFSSMK